MSKSAGTGIALGWRVRHFNAVVVAVSGPPDSPEVIDRQEVTFISDERLREPYHAAGGLRDEAPAFIKSAETAAADAAFDAIRALVSSLDGVTAVGVVGGNRKVPELSRIVMKHALMHTAEADMYERAVIEGAKRAGLPVTTIDVSGKLLDEASDRLGVALAPALAALGKSIGSPWGKDYREATAAALVALAASR